MLEFTKCWKQRIVLHFKQEKKTPGADKEWKKKNRLNIPVIKASSCFVLEKYVK